MYFYTLRFLLEDLISITNCIIYVCKCWIIINIFDWLISDWIFWNIYGSASRFKRKFSQAKILHKIIIEENFKEILNICWREIILQQRRKYLEIRYCSEFDFPVDLALNWYSSQPTFPVIQSNHHKDLLKTYMQILTSLL